MKSVALALLLLTSQKFIIQPLLTSIIPSQPNLTILEPENATVTAPMTVGIDQAASGSKYIFTSVTNTAAKSSSLAQAPTANKVLASTNLSLAVSGNHLVNGSGSTVHLHGVNRSGTEYACFQFGISDGPLDDASVTAMASWGINVVRIPLNEDCWLGINGFPKFSTTAQYQQAIVNYVNTLNAHGIYAWLDLQMAAPAADQSTTILPMPDTDHAPAFWTSIANTFKANPAVVNEILPIESLGAPMRVTDHPENEGDPCRWTIYKSPELVPDWAQGDYPHNPEIVLLSTILPWRNDAFVRFVYFPWLAVTGLAVYALARRIDVPRSLAVLSGTLVLAMPVVARSTLFSMKPDGVLWATFAAGLLFLVRHWRSRQRGCSSTGG